MEYVGEIINLKQHKKRAEQYSNDPEHKHHYGMELDTNIFIDATSKGNVSRYINHSCDPNATIELWIVNRFPRTGFFAIKDIQTGEEITFDYMFQRADKNARKCLCGSKKCRGFILAKNVKKIKSPTTSSYTESFESNMPGRKQTTKKVGNIKRSLQVVQNSSKLERIRVSNGSKNLSFTSNQGSVPLKSSRIKAHTNRSKSWLNVLKFL